MGFSRQEYWSGLSVPPSGHLPDPDIKPMSLMSPALAGRFLTDNATREAERTQKREESKHVHGASLIPNPSFLWENHLGAFPVPVTGHIMTFPPSGLS